MNSELANKAVGQLTGDYYNIANKNNFSELGRRVACLLDGVFRIKDLDHTQLKKVNWERETQVEFKFCGSLSTVDSDKLTRLVVISHQLMLRVSITAHAKNYFMLTFHMRTKRDRSKGMSNYCPSIGDAVNIITKHNPAIDDILAASLEGELKSYHLIYTLDGKVKSEDKEFTDLRAVEKWLKSIGAIYFEIGV